MESSISIKYMKLINLNNAVCNTTKKHNRERIPRAVKSNQQTNQCRKAPVVHNIQYGISNQRDNAVPLPFSTSQP